MSDTVYMITAAIIPVVLAITLHEVAHGYVAREHGDPTAAQAGRLTLNPLRHVDPFGTVILPGLLFVSGLPPFGFAKPVPVNFRNLRNPKRDMVWVAAAGPAVNMLMAIGWAILFNLATFMDGEIQTWFANMAQIGIAANIVLLVFNMIPLPPLDGGRVAVGLLPHAIARPLAGLERWGLLIIFAAILGPALINQMFGTNYHPVWAIIQPIVKFLYDGINGLFLIV
ncbi:MAG: site-2 protease family protein [Sphingomonadales bacterium]